MAKPLTRILRKLCNKMGYDLLRLQKTRIHDDTESGHGRGGGFDAFEASVPREIKSFDIYLRSCARIEVFGQERGRFNGAAKSEVLLRCLNSLIRSINYAMAHHVDTPITLTIIDDHSSPSVVDGIEALLKDADCPARLHRLAEQGMSHSLAETFGMAKREAGDVIYFLEDDYLHDERSILETIQSYGRIAATLKTDVILFPADYPEYYRHVWSTHLLLGSHRHWRRIPATTGTQVLSKQILIQHWDKYQGLTRYGSDPSVTEANTINRVLETVPGYSPLPALAVHFQHLDTMSPYFDWEACWNNAALPKA
jgi:hypothetical protein